MGYRGEDLDLRTPQTWSATQSDLAGGGQGDQGQGSGRQRVGYGSGQRNGPIWVDETVLAACNHAFDVALAHRAGEVRLEHLLHALTRIDEAAEALEARGIRVTALRRETGAIITSEIPIGLPNGKGTPRRSEELEETLRLAAMAAARRDSPAGVDDVVRAMHELRPDMPGLSQSARGGLPRYSGGYGEALPPFARNAYGGDAGETLRSRAFGSGETLRGGRNETVASPVAGTPADSIQNSRLDALEQMVRALSTDLANERKVFTGVLQDMQRSVMAQRDDMARFSGGLPERMQSEIADRMEGLERAVMSVRSVGGAPDLGPVIERLAAIERTLLNRQAPAVDLGPIVNRLEIIEEAVLSHEPAAISQLGERVKALEGQIAAERARASEAQSALADQLNVLNALVEGQKSEIASSVLSPLGDQVERLAATLQEAVTAQGRKIDAMQDAHASELKEVHEALVKLNTNQHSLAGSISDWQREGTTERSLLAERLDSLGTRVETAGVTLGGIDAALGVVGLRVEGLEKEAAKPLRMLEGLSSTVEKMHKVTVERYYRRHRILYWLFGTDDWVAASWPSQAERISEDLRAIKTPDRK